jgi:hypothetical protein
MRAVIIALALMASVSAQGRATFTGIITDNECPTGNHGLMKMGDTDEECTKACIDEHGATYLLYDGKVSYTLSDQKAPAAFAGKKVVVTGTLDAKTRTIRVDSIAAAK